MTDYLHAWMDDKHIGIFERQDEHITFQYDQGCEYPISLSLPLSGMWNRKAPYHFLENLLPDNPAVREVMARTTGASSTDTFDLLDTADTTGGIVFSRRDSLPEPTDIPIRLASNEEIADRIAALSHNTAAWWQHDTHARFSLGGNQPKFALQYQQGLWFYSDYRHPSTHIFKPYDGYNTHAPEIEQASMRLAALVGVSVARSDIIRFEDQRVYVTERFDRHIQSDVIKRLHTEDLAQSLGRSPAEKYHIKVKEILSLMSAYDPSNKLAYSFITQLALNTAISNADAHAKNYSLIWKQGTITLSPMYDVLTTTYWTHVSRKLAMSIGGTTGAQQITPYHWRRLAQDNGLDEETVVATARHIAYLVLSHAPEAYANLPQNIRMRLLQELAKANQRIEPLDMGIKL